MKIILAENIGFCFGVERAYRTSLKALEEEKKPCQMLGHLVHNEDVIEKLKSKGLEFVSSLDEIREGTVIIRAHGVGDETMAKLEEKNIKIVDATCLLVKRAQDFARVLDKEGRKVIIIGDRGHAEVNAINGAIRNEAIIVEDEKDLSDISSSKPLGVIIQTTQEKERANEILKILKGKFPDIKVCDTLCNSVMERQEEVKRLAKKADVILVIGSKKSANTQRLVEVARKKKESVYGIENADQIRDDFFTNAKTVGVISGTSTPNWLIEEVVERIKKINS